MSPSEPLPGPGPDDLTWARSTSDPQHCRACSTRPSRMRRCCSRSWRASLPGRAIADDPDAPTLAAVQSAEGIAFISRTTSQAELDTALSGLRRDAIVGLTWPGDAGAGAAHRSHRRGRRTDWASGPSRRRANGFDRLRRRPAGGRDGPAHGRGAPRALRVARARRGRARQRRGLPRARHRPVPDARRRDPRRGLRAVHRGAAWPRSAWSPPRPTAGRAWLRSPSRGSRRPWTSAASRCTGAATPQRGVRPRRGQARVRAGAALRDPPVPAADRVGRPRRRRRTPRSRRIRPARRPRSGSRPSARRRSGGHRRPPASTAAGRGGA